MILRRRPSPPSAADMRRLAEELLTSGLSDAELLKRIHDLEPERRWRLPMAADVLLPALYQRNRSLFRWVMLQLAGGMWRSDSRSAVKETLKALTTVRDWADRDDEVELFRTLWRECAMAEGLMGKNLEARAWEELQRRWAGALRSTDRQTLLKKYDFWFTLPEELAVELYRTDADVARSYILGHLPWRSFRRLGTGPAEPMMTRLRAEAAARNDDAFHRKLYARMCGGAEWLGDVEKVLALHRQPEELCAALTDMHPEGLGSDFTRGALRMLQVRGVDVVPYLERHVPSMVSWGMGSGGASTYGDLLREARRPGFAGLWAQMLLFVSGGDHLKHELTWLLEGDKTTPAPAAEFARSRLLALAGATPARGGWLGCGSMLHVPEALLLKIDERFPELLRGPWLDRFSINVFQPLPAMAERALERDDTPLIARFTGAYLCFQFMGGRHEKNAVEAVERYSRFYEELGASKPARFLELARLALNALPAMGIYRYPQLIASNRLARLIFRFSEEHLLESSEAVLDFLEAPNIHVQVLAWRLLASNDHRAGALAARHVHLLSAALLRKLHRKSRLVAIAACANAVHDTEAAGMLLRRAHEAMDLPAEKYPHDAVMALIGKILHRYPEWRGERERPVVYEREVSP